MEDTRSAVSSPADSTTDVAKQEAGAVANQVGDASRQVADTAKTEATEVLRDASLQMKQVWGQARDEITVQSSTQQQRIADGLKGLSAELHQMAQGSAGPGLASDLAHQAAAKADEISSWLSQREPADVLDDVKAFARRQPGAFLVGAAVVGILAGRLTRGLADDHREQSDSDDAPATARPASGQAHVRPAGVSMGTGR